MPRRTVVVLVLLVISGLLGAAVAPPAAATDELSVVRYRSPVEAPVVDRFDLPAQRWQAGNRGIDYGTAPGTPITAAAAGEVVFSGAVAGALHVTVRHADGLRTSYSFLAETSVRAGQKVRAGQQVGVAGGPVHVGVRTPDGTYLDPEALFAGTLEPRVRLVPGAEDGLDPLAERRSLLDTLLDRGAAAVDYVRSHGEEWLELVAHYATELDPVTHVGRAVNAAQDWWDQLQDCTPASMPVPKPTGRRIAVLVSGLGTASSSNSAWEIDTATLGYAEADVVRFSYQGGRAPGPGVEPPSTTPTTDGPGALDLVTAAHPGLDDIPVHEFTSADSQQSVEVSADRLEDLLNQVSAAEPGVPIDVIAHSQGGVVARLGVVEAGAEGGLPATVENLVTIGTPHQGAPLATGVLSLEQTAPGRDVLTRIRDSKRFEDLDDRLPAITQLSETSDLLATMRDTPIPRGVRFTSLGAAGDLTVPGTATDDDRADTHRLIPTGIAVDTHGELASMPATTREVGLAVAGAGPTCQSFGEAFATFAEAEVIRTVETTAAADLAGGAVVAVPVRASLEPLRALGD